MTPTLLPTLPAPPAPVTFLADDLTLPALEAEVRTARPGEACVILALVSAHQDEGHLLPRSRAELEARTARFVVAVVDGRVVACAELAPLSAAVAEVRSLVVDRAARGGGVGRRLVDELLRRAAVEGFERLCAFSHEPGYFMRMGFSLVPHTWVPEKLAADCRSCALFRQCGQQAVVRAVSPARRPRHA
ncbi:MAG: GNAT family N-acetyltransferase [Vicinamibacterales bacterium]